MLVILLSGAARAETLQAPIGGKSLSLGNARVGCSSPGGGWLLDASGHFVRPPLLVTAIGKPVELKIAPEPSLCAKSTTTLTLVATARWPTLDPSSVVFSVDDGRVDVRGRNLRGLGLAWRKNPGAAIDSCENPKLEPNAEHCSFSVGHGLPADPGSGALAWVPYGGRAGADVVSFTGEGKAAPPERFVLTPARVILHNLLPPDSAIDLSSGRGRVPLTHPDAVMSVSCGSVRCEIAQGNLVVKGLSTGLSSVNATFGLLPKVVLERDGTTEIEPVAHLAVLHCPMSVISGPPLRGVESARTVVRLEGRCAQDVSSLHFMQQGETLDVVRSETTQNVADVLLKLGKIDATTLSIVAVRGEEHSNTVAVARSETIPAPNVHSALELPGYPNIDFIPNNRPALVHVPKLQHGAVLEVLPLEGVYRVQRQASKMFVRGSPNAAGLVALSFGYRNSRLSSALSHENLAILTDPLQRSIHEANIPAPVDTSALGVRPLVELVCSEHGKIFRVTPGETAHLPFSMRDNCRVIFHRERLGPGYGTQKLSLDIEVLSLDGASRGEGHVSQTVVLRSGSTPRLAWIRGVKSPFDRVIVRLSHAADEAHYIGALEIPTGAPAVQWTLILGTGHARLYATTAIPTGLYRFGDADHSGVLSLNFGIVSRLTWLESDGTEGLIGLETGVMAFGLTNSKSTTGQSLTRIGVVGGLGLSIPIANRSSPTAAAINLHGWAEMDVSESSGGRFAFIFGPSISIGNVGTNL